MKETKILVNINEDGEISAETFGFLGEVCLSELEQLLGESADFDELVKKDEFYKKSVVSNKKTIVAKRY